MAFEIYQGTGHQYAAKFPSYDNIKKLDDPSGYIATEELRNAVNVAITLGMPLLLTGEPGTGKSQLAYNIAHELNLGDPLVFITKTGSQAKELFYRYDSLSHFHHTQIKKTDVDINDYIHFEALGKSVLMSDNSARTKERLPEAMRGQSPRKSVVLIDEIDKAPRDFTNDILNEIEGLKFTVNETGEQYKIEDQAYRPIIILTSNSEKNLPDPFLRRCIFYHIPFPDSATLSKIVNSRLQLSNDFKSRMLQSAIDHFEGLRAKPLRKKPATAELLSWLHILDKMEVDMTVPLPEQLEKLAQSYIVLAKNKEDLNRLRTDL